MIAVIIDVVPMPVPGWSALFFATSVSLVFYWSLHRPYQFNSLQAFLPGLVLDSLSGQPIGMSSLLFLLVRWIVVFEQRFFVAADFIVIWASFIAISLMMAFLHWLISCLYAGALFDPLILIGPSLLMILIFPMISFCLDKLLYLIPGEHDAQP